MADTHENYEPLTKQMRTPASPPIFLVVMHIHENYESLTKQMRTPASPPPPPIFLVVMNIALLIKKTPSPKIDSF